MTPRPKSLVHGVLIEPRIAYLLLQRSNLAELRVKSRGGDQALYDALVSITMAGHEWASYVDGTKLRNSTEPEPPSNNGNYSPNQVAAKLHITDHGVRKAIRNGDLPATKVDNRWQITAADLHNYQLKRK